MHYLIHRRHDADGSHRETHIMKDILNVNGAKFARTNDAFVETLFDVDGTACGMFRKLKNGIQFMLPDGELFAFLVANDKGERFFVNASKAEGGRMRTQFSTGEYAEKMLNLSECGYRETIEIARKTWDSLK